MTTTTRPSTGTAGPARGTAFQRARARLLIAGANVVERLPEDAVIRTADLGGGIAYRFASARREQARRNLGRIAEWAAATGSGGPALRAAARDPEALERIVEAAFHHHGRYWAELLRAPRMTADYIRERVDMSGAEVLVPSIEAGGPVVFVGMHFGAVELPAYYAGQVAGRPATGPMETVGDPELARWYLETRGAMGVRLVGLREARRELLAAAKADGVLAIVADRDITGGGIPTEFGTAPLPVGAALVALETGAPMLAIAVRRTGIGRYAARVEEVAIPSNGTRRERVEAILAGEARKFESFIVDAPAQWWGAFYPIWPDLEVDR